MINPRTKIASKLKQWFRNDQFVRHKTLWINKTSLPLNRLLCISNSMRLSISEFHKYNGGCKCRVVGRIDDIDKVNSSNSVLAHIKIKDISGSLSVGLSHKQICFILQKSTLDLPTRTEEVKYMDNIRTKLFSHIGDAYVFVLEATLLCFKSKVHKVVDVTHVYWAEECAYQFTCKLPTYS
ncbi:uncharacterized protein LOC125491652 [Beta vulgaris subsp. vulgaris]|uniref:uncharacterized protein LOC125491652 n=2 Tax=Beta vulgaris subsp. vulgaris TaxID=3555 RepID=UPI0020366D8E|nr:uncharacterized protein LOC125491652 [Beta vulgaris subsp. vulgaris]